MGLTSSAAYSVQLILPTAYRASLYGVPRLKQRAFPLDPAVADTTLDNILRYPLDSREHALHFHAETEAFSTFGPAAR